MGKLDAFFGGREKELLAKFSDMGTLIAQAGGTLQKLAEDLPHAHEHAQRLHAIEHDCDALVADIFNLLTTTSHFSLEHEDITALAQRGDDVVDLIWGAADRIDRYALSDPDPELLEIAKILAHMTQEIQGLFQNIKNPPQKKNLQELIKLFHAEENRADELKREVSIRRFKLTDTIENEKRRTVWEKVFEHLESATDRCVDITDVVGHFSEKYGH